MKKTARQLMWEDAARKETRKGNNLTAMFFTMMAAPDERDWQEDMNTADRKVDHGPMDPRD